MPNFLKYGLLAAAISSVYSIGLQLLGSDLRFNTWSMNFMIFIFPLIFMTLAVKAERFDQEGLISFGEALKTSFLTYMIFIVIALIVGQLLISMYSEVDWERMVEVQKSGTEFLLSLFNMDQVMIDEALDQLSVEAMKQKTKGVGVVIMGSLMYAFVGLIMSLIISAIMKKNPTP